MATLLWQRDISSDVDGVKQTFSGWDQCMSKAYCKWPAIIGIIVGSLIIVSILWCLASCLCGCVSCLTCCGSCCSCCGSNRHRNQGYAQPAPTPQLQQYPQYASAQPPMYGHPQPQFAHFDVPGGGGAKSAQYKYNEDSLPQMPSWDTSRVTRTPSGHDVEMNRLDAAASAPMLPRNTAQSPYAGDIGMMSGPTYQDTSYHHSMEPMSYSDPYAGYSGAQQQSGTMRGGGGYEPSVAPPSYRTGPVSIVSPPVGRKPVSGSWREV